MSQDPGTNILTSGGVAELGRRWGEDEQGYFPCPLPGHDGRALFVHEQDLACLGCCEGSGRSLAEVWAAIAYGADSRRRTNIELATWWRRLAYDLGGLQPVNVDVPSLATDAPPELHRVRQGFVLLLGLRWRDHPPRPVAFSVRFAAAWCRLSKTEANVAIRVLLRQDVMREADRIGRIRLYEPGGAKPLLAPRGDGCV